MRYLFSLTVTGSLGLRCIIFQRNKTSKSVLTEKPTYLVIKEYSAKVPPSPSSPANRTIVIYLIVAVIVRDRLGDLHFIQCLTFPLPLIFVRRPPKNLPHLQTLNGEIEHSRLTTIRVRRRFYINSAPVFQFSFARQSMFPFAILIPRFVSLYAHPGGVSYVPNIMSSPLWPVQSMVATGVSTSLTHHIVHFGRETPSPGPKNRRRGMKECRVLYPCSAITLHKLSLTPSMLSITTNLNSCSILPPKPHKQ